MRSLISSFRREFPDNMKRYLLFLLLLFFTSSCEKIEANNYEPHLLDKDPLLTSGSVYIAVLGDIQTYTNNNSYMPYLQHTMDWLFSQKRYGYSIDCILQVGDVTNNNTPVQWERFKNVTGPIAKEILYVACTGNHDYDWEGSNINNRTSTRINDYALFPLTKANIIASFEPGKIENVVVSLMIHDEPYDLIVLEFGPRTEILKWADDYVSSRPNRKFILMTHEFLTAKGVRSSYIKNWNSPEQVWQHLVKDNDNIVCVLCGHNGFSAKLFSKNSAGREVPQILFNLQYQVNGGDGWVQLWEFPEQSDSVTVSIYNTIRREFHTDPSTSFKFRYRY